MRIITKAKLGKLLALLAVLLLAGSVLHILLTKQTTATPLFAMPEDQNRRNNFVANPQAWMVDSQLHLSLRSKTMQAGEDGQLRPINSRRMMATATRNHYLYAYLGKDDSAFLVNHIELMRRSNGTVIHRAEYASKAYLDEDTLYYISAPDNQYRLVQYDLETDALVELMPWVTSFCVVDDLLLYTSGGAACDFYAPLESRQPVLRCRNLQTGKDWQLLADAPYHGISSYFLDNGHVFFDLDNQLYQFDPLNQQLTVLLETTGISLLNVFRNQLYLSYATPLGENKYSYDIRRHNLQTGEEHSLFFQPLETGMLSPRLSVLDEGVWVCSVWDKIYTIENHGQRHTLQ